MRRPYAKKLGEDKYRIYFKINAQLKQVKTAGTVASATAFFHIH